MAKHQAGTARVVPIILRPTDLVGPPFEQLQALPRNAKPVTTWSNREEALHNVVVQLRSIVKDLSSS